MSRSFGYRVHEWLADHCKFVQYPGVRVQRRPFFRYPMPWHIRALLVLIGAVTLPICLIAIFLLGVLAWAALTA
jgi:hypothetical protein